MRFGLCNPEAIDLSPADLRIGLEVWLNRLTRAKGFEARVIYYQDPSDMARDFEKGAIDGAVATPLDFVRHFDASLLTPGIIGYKNSKADSSIVYLLTRRSLKKKTLTELLGRNISVPAIASGSRLYLKVLALKRGLDPDRLDFETTPNAQRAVFNLYFGKSDLAMVTKAEFDIACELNPSLKKSLVILRQRKLFVENLFFLRKGMDPAFYDYLLANAVNLPRTPGGKTLMTLFRTDTMEKCTPSELKTTRKLYEEYIRLKHAKEKHENR